jgi:hypothetical protein
MTSPQKELLMRDEPGSKLWLFLASVLVGTMVPAPAAAQAVDVDLVAFGNSQIYFCGGSLAPFEGLAAAGGFTVSTLRVSSPARIQDHLAKVSNRIADGNGAGEHFLLTHQESAWDALPLEQIYSAGEDLHRAIVRAGGTTVLFMTYATGTSTSSPEGQRVSEYKSYWETLKSRLDNLVIDGARHEAILIPVMLLWEEGKQAYPHKPQPRGTAQELRCRNSGWMHDVLHGGYLAQYANAALFYAYLTCKDPRQLSLAGQTLAPADATWARERAWSYFNTYYKPQACR